MTIQRPHRPDAKQRKASHYGRSEASGRRSQTSSRIYTHDYIDLLSCAHPATHLKSPESTRGSFSKNPPPQGQGILFLKHTYLWRCIDISHEISIEISILSPNTAASCFSLSHNKEKLNQKQCRNNICEERYFFPFPRHDLDRREADHSKADAMSDGTGDRHSDQHQ